MLQYKIKLSAIMMQNAVQDWPAYKETAKIHVDKRHVEPEQYAVLQIRYHSAHLCVNALNL